MVSISNINNKYQLAKESTYGTLPGPFTALDFGHVQSITATQVENIERLTSINGGHLTNRFEDGIYYVSGSIELLCTKASLPLVLEAYFGGYSDDATDYTITSAPSTASSYSIKVELDSTKTLQVTGMAFTTFNMEAAKDGNVSINMDFIAQKMIKATETLTVTPNTDKIFKGLDTTITFDADNYVFNSFSLSSSWNIDDTEGRGIETVTDGDRRTIKRVIRHSLDVSGSFEFEASDSFEEIEYSDERTDKQIVLTLNRGTDNAHVFTLANCRTDSEELPLSVDNSVRVITADFEAIDVGVTGDL